MKKRNLFCLIAVLLAVMVLISACVQSGSSTDSSIPSDTGSSADSPSEAADNGDVEAEELEPYTYTHYYNYDWWDIKEWGKDEVSKYLNEKFNIHIEFSKPDTDAAAKLNTMIAAGDLPDAIMMDRNHDYLRMIELGLLEPLEPFMENNPNYAENIMESTREMLKVDGKLYIIPQWARSAPTGGNMAWMYVDSIYSELGRPSLETFEDLYNYAVKVKNEVPTTKDGLSIIPVLFVEGGDGSAVMDPFYRSFGGVRNGWYTVIDGEYQLLFRDPLFKEVTMEINKWWREGLMSETQFTDSADQVLEKIVAGRCGLLYFDQSTDDTKKFRKIYKENHPGDSYEMVLPNLFPPANGLSPDDVYGEWSNTVGGSGIVITTNAENPQRIFDLRTYMLTPEAAMIQMYGPPGILWDDLDEDGLPNLKKPESELTSDEVNRLGVWFWMEPGHSDNVDNLKYAVNAKLPPEKQSWVVNNQANLQTPIKWITDEFVGITDDIDPQSPEGITRTLVEDYIGAQYPKVIMANTVEEAEALFEDIINFADENGMEAVEELMNQKYQENLEKVETALTKGRYAK